MKMHRREIIATNKKLLKYNIYARIFLSIIWGYESKYKSSLRSEDICPENIVKFVYIKMSRITSHTIVDKSTEENIAAH